MNLQIRVDTIPLFPFGNCHSAPTTKTFQTGVYTTVYLFKWFVLDEVNANDKVVKFSELCVTFCPALPTLEEIFKDNRFRSIYVVFEQDGSLVGFQIQLLFSWQSKLNLSYTTSVSWSDLLIMSANSLLIRGSRVSPANDYSLVQSFFCKPSLNRGLYFGRSDTALDTLIKKIDNMSTPEQVELSRIELCQDFVNVLYDHTTKWRSTTNK
jgi:hypothetical protein